MIHLEPPNPSKKNGRDKQSAGYSEANKTKMIMELNKKKKECESELLKLFSDISTSNNEHLDKTNVLLGDWVKNNSNVPIIDSVNNLLEYLNTQLSILEPGDKKYEIIGGRIKHAKKRLVKFLNSMSN